MSRVEKSNVLLNEYDICNSAIETIRVCFINIKMIFSVKRRIPNI